MCPQGVVDGRVWFVECIEDLFQAFTHLGADTCGSWLFL